MLYAKLELNLCSETTTVSAHIEARGSIFLSGFLGGALIKFIIPGLLIELGFYYFQKKTQKISFDIKGVTSTFSSIFWVSLIFIEVQNGLLKLARINRAPARLEAQV